MSEMELVTVQTLQQALPDVARAPLAEPQLLPSKVAVDPSVVGQRRPQVEVVPVEDSWLLVGS